MTDFTPPLMHADLATQRRRMLRAGLTTVAALAALSLGRRVHAMRDGSLRILCSGPAGSIPDLVARAIGDQLPATLHEFRDQYLDQRRQVDPAFARVEDRALRRDCACRDTWRD